MTRKYLAIFVMTFIVLVSLGTGIFGKQGIVRNSALKKELEASQYTEEMLRLRVEELARTEIEASRGDELKDIAFRLGYNLDGDTVYYFSEPDTLDSVDDLDSGKALKEEKELFTGLSFGTIAGVSAGIAMLVTIVLMLVVGRKNPPDTDSELNRDSRNSGSRGKYDY